MNTPESIRARRTIKVLADPAAPFPTRDEELAPVLDELLDLATRAPFHYPAHGSHRAAPMDSPVPWRFHVLPGSSCRTVIRWIEEEGTMKGKMPNMLAAAEACVLATWLPDPSEDAVGFQSFAPSLRNMEHIAAASCAVQNLLLAATARGLSNYWSSGGVFRTEAAYDHLGIGHAEVLLGAIFLFPDDVVDAMTKPGAHRDTQGPSASWSRTVAL